MDSPISSGGLRALTQRSEKNYEYEKWVHEKWG